MLELAFNTFRSRLTSRLTPIAILTVAHSALAQPQLPLAGPDEQPSAVACDALNERRMPELAALSAEWIAADSTGRPAQNIVADDRLTPTAHCRVRGRIEPAIRFELWLPRSAAWNGRFLAVGAGTSTGLIATERMASALNEGYATASTDTGHAAGELAWLGNVGSLRDFSYRAIYEMTAKAEALIASYYDRPADYRYFNGCSLGGRQGLMEAQRFPGDYDGIVAGAPVNAFADTQTTQLWAARTARPIARGQGLLDPDSLARVNDAAIAQCDTLDGVADGVIEDPRRCNFDPGRLQCGLASAGQCLTSSQVAAVRDIYRGPWDPETGPIAPGFAIGSETRWDFALAPEPPASALEFFRRAVLADPLWNWRELDIVSDYAMARAETTWLMDATATDLSDFRDRGGKLLIYHGWNDAKVSPLATIRYYEGVEGTLVLQSNPSRIATRDFARLFLVPGMGHCGGGTGTADFDGQRAIEDWVERGFAPARIEAARIEDGRTIRTRPLCPYPQTARYRGSGNTDRSGSFVCAE